MLAWLVPHSGGSRRMPRFDATAASRPPSPPHAPRAALPGKHSTPAAGLRSSCRIGALRPTGGGADAGCNVQFEFQICNLHFSVCILQSSLSFLRASYFSAEVAHGCALDIIA